MIFSRDRHGLTWFLRPGGHFAPYYKGNYFPAPTWPQNRAPGPSPTSPAPWGDPEEPPGPGHLGSWARASISLSDPSNNNRVLPAPVTRMTNGERSAEKGEKKKSPLFSPFLCRILSESPGQGWDFPAAILQLPSLEAAPGASPSHQNLPIGTGPPPETFHDPIYPDSCLFFWKTTLPTCPLARQEAGRRCPHHGEAAAPGDIIGLSNTSQPPPFLGFGVVGLLLRPPAR